MTLKFIKKIKRVGRLIWAMLRNWITWQEMEEEIVYVMTYV